MLLDEILDCIYDDGGSATETELASKFRSEHPRKLQTALDFCTRYGLLNRSENVYVMPKSVRQFIRSMREVEH